MTTYKLGKHPADHARIAKCIQAHDILNLSTLPDQPAAFDWSQVNGADLAYPMLGNNQYGDCVFASACHQIETWTGQTGPQEVIDDVDALDAYARFTGFDPATGANDGGANMLDVAQKWQEGMPIARHTIRAFVAVNVKNLSLVASAANFFGGLWTGWALPVAWQGADEWLAGPNTSGNWALGSWGGHAVHATTFSPGMFGIKTWGGRMPVSPAAWSTYCDEAYALVSNDMWHVLTGDRCPAGIDVQKLIDLLPVVGR